MSGGVLRPRAAWRLRLVATAFAIVFAAGPVHGMPPAAPPAVPAGADGGAAPPQFRDAAEARRFRALVGELRCVMCQNQSLADSDAMIAHELRAEVLALMREGLDDDAIKAHLVARYGEFVLYRPRVGPATWLLWFGPALLVFAGGWLVWRLARRGGPRARAVPEDEEQEW